MPVNRRSGDAGPDWVIERNYMAAGGKGVSFPIASRACDDERAGVVWLYRRHGKVIGVCPGMSFCGESSLAALDYCSMVHDWLYCSIEYCGPPRPGSGEWRPIDWEASQALLERLLAPAAKPPHLQVIEWRPGDVVIWANLQTQHSVTPTNAYSIPGQRRLMTRTAMQPTVDVLNSSGRSCIF